MALIKCKECGSEISDIATVCPHCGYPIQAVRNARIDQQNRAYYKDYNRTQLIYNLFAFLVSFVTGYDLFRRGAALWSWVIFGIAFVIILVVCLSKFIYIVGLFMAFSQYKVVPKWLLVISVCLGYVLGWLVCMRWG